MLGLAALHDGRLARYIAMLFVLCATASVGLCAPNFRSESVVRVDVPPPHPLSFKSNAMAQEFQVLANKLQSLSLRLGNVEKLERRVAQLESKLEACSDLGGSSNHGQNPAQSGRLLRDPDATQCSCSSFDGPITVAGEINGVNVSSDISSSAALIDNININKLSNEAITNIAPNQTVIGSFGANLFQVGTPMAENQRWAITVTPSGSLQFSSPAQNVSFDTVDVLQQLAQTRAQVAEMELWFRQNTTLTLTETCGCYWEELPDGDLPLIPCGWSGENRCLPLTCTKAGYFANGMTIYLYNNYMNWRHGAVRNALRCCQPCYKGTLMDLVVAQTRQT